MKILQTKDGAVRNRLPHKQLFTLPEMLVVITIVMIMASMLLPALSEAKNTALVGLCMNNMRQSYMALHNYDDDWSHLPPSKASVGTGADSVNDDEPSSYMVFQATAIGLGLLAKDVNSPIVPSLFCPFSDFSRNGEFGTDNWNDPTNFVISWAYRGLRDINPGDANRKRIDSYNLPDKQALYCDYTSTFPTDFFPQGESHNFRNANVTFADGHIKTKRASEGYPILGVTFGYASQPADMQQVLDCFADEDDQDNFLYSSCY
jgi:prepilin-type processing-associated H-X9-DG protein